MSKIRKTAYERVLQKMEVSKKEREEIEELVCSQGLKIVKEMASEKRIAIRIRAVLRRLKREKKITVDQHENIKSKVTKAEGRITQGQRKKDKP